MKKRVLTGVIGGLGFLAFLYWGGVGFATLLFLLSTLGYYEWIRLNDIHIKQAQGLAGLLLLWGVTGIGIRGTLFDWLTFGDLLWGVLLFLLVWTVFSKNRFHIIQTGYIIIGAIYVGAGFHAMITARLADHGFVLVLLILLATSATDTLAFFVGKKWGTRKMWPAISPNKTWEGSAGGVAGAVLIGLLFHVMSGLFSLGYVLLISITVGVVAQMGDLIESAVKRHFGVKDSGKLLPGHGGVLDRFDSWLFVFFVLGLFRLI